MRPYLNELNQISNLSLAIYETAFTMANRPLRGIENVASTFENDII